MRQAGASAWGSGGALRWEVDRKTILTITQRIAARCLKVKANPKHRTRKFQANNHTHIHIHRAKQKKDVCIDMSRRTNKNMKKRVGSIALTALVGLAAFASPGIVSVAEAKSGFTADSNHMELGRALQSPMDSAAGRALLEADPCACKDSCVTVWGRSICYVQGRRSCPFAIPSMLQWGEAWITCPTDGGGATSTGFGEVPGQESGGEEVPGQGSGGEEVPGQGPGGYEGGDLEESVEEPGIDSEGDLDGDFGRRNLMEYEEEDDEEEDSFDFGFGRRNLMEYEEEDEEEDENEDQDED